MELKHIAPYLHYGLKVRLHNGEIVTFTVLKLSQFLRGEIGIKPILRPLSDLTKEIEHNGERFVPIDVLNELLETNSIEIEMRGSGVYFTNVGRSVLFSLEEINDITQKLLEWKFDVFNRIGIDAIDVNTLQTNPYK